MKVTENFCNVRDFHDRAGMALHPNGPGELDAQGIADRCTVYANGTTTVDIITLKNGFYAVQKKQGSQEPYNYYFFDKASAEEFCVTNGYM